MKRLTFIKSLLVSPFIPLTVLAVASKDNQSEYEKCYNRISLTAFTEGLTPEELDWFTQELLKVDTNGDLAGNFGKSFVVRFLRYLKGSQIDCRECGFIHQMMLLAGLRVNYPEMFSNKEIEKFCGVFYVAKLDRLLKNINTVKDSSLWVKNGPFSSNGEKYSSVTLYEN